MSNAVTHSIRPNSKQTIAQGGGKPFTKVFAHISDSREPPAKCLTRLFSAYSQKASRGPDGL